MKKDFGLTCSLWDLGERQAILGSKVKARKEMDCLKLRESEGFLFGEPTRIWRIRLCI